MMKNPDNGRDLGIAVGVMMIVSLLAGGAFAGSVPDAPTGSDYILYGSTPQISPVLKYIVVSPSPSTTLTVGQKQNITSRAYDQYNNPMAGVDISWTVSNIGVGNVIPVKARTDVTGGVTSTFTALVKGIAIVNAKNASVVSNNIALIINAAVPGIKVTSPNGGENWTHGTTQMIKWNSTGSPGAYVRIELLKPGRPNQLIISSTLNDGLHPWLIPAAQTPGSDYKVKITSTINASINDTSDKNFIIPVPSFKVVFPNGGENLIRGTIQTIKWNSTESPGTYVKIELLKPGKPNQLIILSTLNDGSHPWLIPVAQTPGTDYKVKITSTINASNNDTSDNSFTIPVPSFKIIFPNGGENWTRGTTKIINWTSTENPKGYVKIELLRPGKPNQLIISATLNDGSHPWLIPAAQTPGTDYKVKITSTINASNNDTSDNKFTIPIPSFKVTSPNGSESWIRGTTQTIKWNSTESPGTYVKIELLKPGKANQLIISATLNDGSHPWLIPAAQAPGSDYKVKITSTINASHNDTSDNNFNIPVPSFTVVTPNGGENWTRGTTKIINWTSTENPKGYVKIELLKPGKPNQLIILATLNDGSHPWFIPALQAPGTDYKVKVTSTSNLSITDMSNSTFSISS
ncbi:MAG: Ig-like domain-containing protein [Candidatus Methanoperedens sp.]